MSPRNRFLLLLLAAAVVCGVPIFTRDLWTPDEPRYAEVAREMMVTGNYLVPHLDGEIYREKPPLSFWLMDAASAPTGTVNDLGVRLPSLMAALFTLCFVYGLARRMYGDRDALLSALVLAACFRFWWQSNSGQIDMLLTACTTFSLYALWRWHESRGTRWAIGFYIGIALGLLAKGPPALAVTVPAALIFVWRSGKNERRALRLWLGVPLAIAPVALWFIMASRAGGGEVSQDASGMFQRQVVGRLLTGVNHPQPPWHYLVSLPLDWLPWVMFLPWMLLYCWQQRREGPAMRLLLSWTLPALIFFHLIVEKRGIYLLPLYPPLAILVARSIAALVDRGRFKWFPATAICWALGTLAFASTPYLSKFLPYTVAWDNRLYLITVAGTLCAVWTILILVRHAWRHWPIALGAQTLALFLVSGLSAIPVANQVKSPKEFCAPVRALAAAGPVDVIAMRIGREELSYYSNSVQRRVLNHPGQSALCNSEDGFDCERQFHFAMGRIQSEVALSSFTTPTPDEHVALERARDRALSNAGLAGDQRRAYLDRVNSEVGEVLHAMRAPTPAVAFVLVEDWYWILSLPNDTCFLTALSNRQISSRNMLLLVNPAAKETLRRLGITPSPGIPKAR